LFEQGEIDKMKNTYKWEKTELLKEPTIDINKLGDVTNEFYTSKEYFKQVIKTKNYDEYEGDIYIDFVSNIMYIDLKNQTPGMLTNN